MGRGRYKYFDLGKFIQACIITVLLIPVAAVAFAAFNVWYVHAH